MEDRESTENTRPPLSGEMKETNATLVGLNQRQTLEIPGEMVNRADRGQDGGTSRRKSQSDQTGAGNFQRGAAILRNLDDASFAGEGSRHIEISVGVESYSLRPA